MLDVTPLRRHPAFRRLWFGQGISFIGTEIAEVALAYQMYQLTGSTQYGLYNQLINGHTYYTQREYSDATSRCVLTGT